MNRTSLLLVVLGMLILFWGVLVGGKFYLSKAQELNSDLEQLETQVDNLYEVSRQSELWQARKQWIDEHLSEAKPDQTVRLEMSELINVPKSLPIVVKNPEFPEAEDSIENSVFSDARIRFKATGKLEDVLPWLHGLIVKEKLLTMSYLKITQGDSKEGDAEFAVELKKYYAKN